MCSVLVDNIIYRILYSLLLTKHTIEIHSLKTIDVRPSSFNLHQMSKAGHPQTFKSDPLPPINTQSRKFDTLKLCLCSKLSKSNFSRCNLM